MLFVQLLFYTHEIDSDHTCSHGEKNNEHINTHAMKKRKRKISEKLIYIIYTIYT